MTNITIYSDYVCPFCLLAEQVVSDAIGEKNISINWQAFELRPYPVPTLKPEDSYLPTIWQQSVYPLAKRLGVAMQLPTISPQPRTAKAFELLVMAQDKGLDHEYSMRALRAFFQENQDIGNTEILVRLATEVGLNANDARSALNNGIYAERHREALRHAREDMTITSVPTIVIGKQVFRGTPSIEQLRQAIDQFEANDDSKNNNATSQNV